MMPSDLDRAYVINGDALAGALDNHWVYAENRSGTQIRDARELARGILGDIATPLARDHLPMPPDAPATPLEDKELLAMQELLDALSPLGPAAVKRVLNWAHARYIR